ncbi:MAG: hypothetical protein UU47_C0001G0008 [candidate division TM6 bacterium GW2011_GWE2_41_16]|nr:MAG: hypothetical protein UU47_C0001G0008 [candidate division TM6 bacterium GW2011_GWE2_41_16]
MRIVRVKNVTTRERLAIQPLIFLWLIALFFNAHSMQQQITENSLKKSMRTDDFAYIPQDLVHNILQKTLPCPQDPRKLLITALRLMGTCERFKNIMKGISLPSGTMEGIPLPIHFNCSSPEQITQNMATICKNRRLFIDTVFIEGAFDLERFAKELAHVALCAPRVQKIFVNASEAKEYTATEIIHLLCMHASQCTCLEKIIISNAHFKAERQCPLEKFFNMLKTITVSNPNGSPKKFLHIVDAQIDHIHTHNSPELRGIPCPYCQYRIEHAQTVSSSRPLNPSQLGHFGKQKPEFYYLLSSPKLAPKNHISIPPTTSTTQPLPKGFVGQAMATPPALSQMQEERLLCNCLGTFTICKSEIITLSQRGSSIDIEQAPAT